MTLYRRSMPRVRALAWYPIVLVAAAVLWRFVAIDVSPFAMFRSLAVAMAAVAVIEITVAILVRDPDRVGIFTIAIIAVVLGWGDGRVFALLALLLVVMFLLGRMPRRRVRPGAITSWFNVFAIVLFLVVVANGLLSGRVAEGLRELSPATAQVAARASHADPDIYVIVMDGYARPDNLLARFEYDDQPFLEFLAARRFVTSLHSRSNYSSTALTLASMLNMAYLEDIPAVARLVREPAPGSDPQGDGSFRQAINDNRALSELRARGYETVSIGSGWEQVSVRRVDTYADAGGLNSFETLLLTSTVGLAAIADAIAPDVAGEQARARVLTSLASLSAVGRTPTSRPRFVLVHLTVPHPPTIFGPGGQAVRLSLSDPWLAETSYAIAKEHYAGQVQYTNTLVEAVLTDLLASLPPSSVIVLMSDHGARYGSDDQPMVRDVESVENFFAARTPGRPGLFGDSPSPVNLFPTLFNAYLGASLPVQPNRSFVTPWWAPLQLTEVRP